MKEKWQNVIAPGLIVAGGVVLFIVIAWFLITDDSVSAEQIPLYDHSQCQYPHRLSNPVDGCDNSDPARPECMKIGTEDCVLPRIDESVSISTPIVAPAPSHAVVSDPTPVKRGCYE